MQTENNKIRTEGANVRSLTIQPRIRVSRYNNKSVPEIKLCGNWLKDAGFNINKKVLVTTRREMLIVKTIE